MATIHHWTTDTGRSWQNVYLLLIRLAPWACQMKRILRCGWLSERENVPPILSYRKIVTFFCFLFVYLFVCLFVLHIIYWSNLLGQDGWILASLKNKSNIQLLDLTLSRFLMYVQAIESWMKWSATKCGLSMENCTSIEERVGAVKEKHFLFSKLSCFLQNSVQLKYLSSKI